MSTLVLLLNQGSHHTVVLSGQSLSLLQSEVLPEDRDNYMVGEESLCTPTHPESSTVGCHFAGLCSREGGMGLLGPGQSFKFQGPCHRAPQILNSQRLTLV